MQLYVHIQRAMSTLSECARSGLRQTFLMWDSHTHNPSPTRQLSPRFPEVQLPRDRHGSQGANRTRSKSYLLCSVREPRAGSMG